MTSRARELLGLAQGGHQFTRKSRGHNGGHRTRGETADLRFDSHRELSTLTLLQLCLHHPQPRGRHRVALLNMDICVELQTLVQ